MGNLPQFGNWIKPTCKLEWSEGHIWKAEVEVNSLEPFEYKYVIMQEDMKPIWECDPNRIADLKLLTPIRQGSSSVYELHDHWEQCFVQMQLVYNSTNPRDRLILEINETKPI